MHKYASVEWIQGLASAQACDECGHTAYLWHHVDPSTKLFNISLGGNYPLDVIETELAKCVPMCNSCHSRLHRLLEARA